MEYQKWMDLHVPAERWWQLGKLCAQRHRSSGSKERRHIALMGGYLIAGKADLAAGE